MVDSDKPTRRETGVCQFVRFVRRVFGRFSRMAELRTWRERVATPLRGSGEEKPAEMPPDKLTNRTNPELLRVGLSETGLGQTSESSDKPRTDGQRLIRIGPTTWREAEWARALCVFCPEPVAPGDVIACAEHRGRLEQIVMPWEDRAR